MCVNYFIIRFHCYVPLLLQWLEFSCIFGQGVQVSGTLLHDCFYLCLFRGQTHVKPLCWLRSPFGYMNSHNKVSYDVIGITISYPMLLSWLTACIQMSSKTYMYVITLFTATALSLLLSTFSLCHMFIIITFTVTCSARRRGDKVLLRVKRGKVTRRPKVDVYPTSKRCLEYKYWISRISVMEV